MTCALIYRCTVATGFRDPHHGARATLRWIDTQNDERSRWLRALIARRGKNRAAVALANKNARMVWALLAHDQVYHARVTA
jgi:transposase